MTEDSVNRIVIRTPESPPLTDAEYADYCARVDRRKAEVLAQIAADKQWRADIDRAVVLTVAALFADDFDEIGKNELMRIVQRLKEARR